MKVSLLFFSTLQAVTGTGACQREFAGREAITVGELLEALYREWPALRAWDGKILVAVERRYSDRGDRVTDGQEVAVMPPVQGG
jgi:molybdopterin converting factor small subunit